MIANLRVIPTAEARQAARRAVQVALADEKQYARQHLGLTGKRAPSDVDALRQGERIVSNVLVHHWADLVLGDAVWDALLALLARDRIPAATRAVLCHPLRVLLAQLSDEDAE